MDAIVGDADEAMHAGVFPPMNVTQDDNHFYVRAEVPGIRATDLSITRTSATEHAC